MKLAVVIPAHNEEKNIGDVVSQIPRKVDGISSIQPFVISDNSKDRTSEIAHRAGASVLSHRINLGAGGATLTGLTVARHLDYDLAISLDGDGQHDPKDIPALVDAHFTHGAQLVIGSRFLGQTIAEMPPLKWYGNKIMNGVTYVFSHHPVTDSQSGFRLFGPQFLDRLHHFSTGGYEFCSEAIIIARQQKLLIHEVPIKTIYFADRAGQNWVNGINIFLRLFYRTVTG